MTPQRSMFPVLFLLGASACSREATPPPPAPLSAQTGLSEKGPSAKLEVGEDCSAFEGNDACAQGLCLRVEAGLPRKGFCTVRCKPDDANGCPDAPSKWLCRQIWPSDEGWVCVPDKNWTGRKASFPGGRIPAPIPVKVFGETIDAGQGP